MQAHHLAKQPRPVMALRAQSKNKMLHGNISCRGEFQTGRQQAQFNQKRTKQDCMTGKSDNLAEILASTALHVTR